MKENRNKNLLILIIFLIFSNQLFPQIIPIYKINYDNEQYLIKNITYEGDTMYLLKDSLKDGKWIICYENHPEKKAYECNFQQGKREGWAIYWYRSGHKKFEEYFIAGMRDSTYNEWYTDGRKKVSGHFKSGFEDGYFTDWHQNEKLKFTGNFSKGKRNGCFTGWHENGNKKFEENFQNGVKNGISTEWREDGNTKTKGNFDHGMAIDSLLSWYKNGQIYSIVRYGNNKPISETRFYENGTKMLEIDFIKNPISAIGGEFWDESGKHINHEKWLNWWKSRKTE